MTTSEIYVKVKPMRTRVFTMDELKEAPHYRFMEVLQLLHKGVVTVEGERWELQR